MRFLASKNSLSISKVVRSLAGKDVFPVGRVLLLSSSQFAFSTDTVARLCSARILFGVLVVIFAAALLCITSSSDVFRMGDGFEVIGVDALPVPTKVVDFQSFGNWPESKHISKLVSSPHFAAVPNLPVSFRRLETEKVPAPPSFLDFGVVQFLQSPSVAIASSATSTTELSNSPIAYKHCSAPRTNNGSVSRHLRMTSGEAVGRPASESPAFGEGHDASPIPDYIIAHLSTQTSEPTKGF